MAKTVLIVEDSPTQLEVIKRAVSEAGFEVLTAVSGEEALKVLQDKKADAMVLDVLLPRVDGFEVARRIKAKPETQNIKIISITSFDVGDIQEKAKEAGVDDIVIKPFKPEAIVAKINDLLKD